MARARLVELRAIAPERPEAVLDFGTGLTLVTGASDTGKSHALACIDFALGSSRPPARIDEASGYTEIALELEHDGERYTIVRDVERARIARRANGRYPGWRAGGEELVVKSSKADPPGTLNGWLLRVAGFEPGTQLPKNAAGDTQMLSFRTAAPLFIVKEDEVISSKSPVLSAAPNAPTAARSIFAMMLTGESPPSVSALQVQHRRVALAGHRVEALDSMIAELREQLADDGSTREVIERELARLDESITTHTARILEAGNIVDGLIAERREARAEALSAQERRQHHQQLLERFELLLEHYRADVSRLDFVATGGHFFGQLAASECPECGRAFENDMPCHPATLEAAQVVVAARAETAKLRPLIADVQRAIAEASEDRDEAAHAQALAESRKAEIDAHIDAELRKQAELARERAQVLIGRRRQLEQQLTRWRQLDAYQDARRSAQATASAGAPAGYRAVADPQALGLLARRIRDILTAWDFPLRGELDIDAKTLDIVLDGQPRASHGKGVRAVTRAAFTIALMRHCVQYGTPHPGFVIIDTPLRPFRQTPVGEFGDPHMIEHVTVACLHDLARSKGEGQTIVMENEDPPRDVMAAAKVHAFDGPDGPGRVGFYPTTLVRIPERVSVS